MQKNLLSAVNLKQIRTALVLLLFFISLNNYSQAWQWARNGGATASDNASETCVDPFGNVYVAGTFNSVSIQIGTITVNNSGSSGFDVYVAKYNSAGVVQWAQRIGGALAESVGGVCCDNAGRVYVFGAYTSTLISLPPFTWGNPGSGTYNVFLACIDASGVPQWLGGYGGTGQEFAGSCAYSNASSSVLITGTYFDPTFTIGTTTLTNTSATGKAEIYLAKFSNAGTLQWARTTGSSSCDDWGNNVAVDVNGDVHFCGNFSGTVSTPTTVIGTATLTSAGQQDIYFAKYSNAGTFVWARAIGSTQGGDYSTGIDVDATSNVYLTGYYQNALLSVSPTFILNSGGYDGFVAKFTSSGATSWVRGMNSAGDEYGYDVSVDGNSNAYVTGTFSGTLVTIGTTTLNNTVPGPSSDIFVAKYNTAGTFQWANSAGGTGNEGGSGIAADVPGNAYVVGSTGGNTAFGTNTLSTYGGSDLYVAKIGCLTTSVSGTSSVCEGSSVTLTASGATTYSWSTGATTTSISVSPTVSTNYTVTGTAGSCVGTPATFNVTFLPASLNAGSNLNLLCKQKAVLNATCNPASPTAVAWSPATNLSSSSVLNPTVTGGSTITYTVNVTLNNGCVKSNTVNVSTYAQTPNICIVTVDSLGFNNEIYWEKTLYPQADSFIVYRETSLNTYKRIGAQNYSAFSMYVDTNRSIGPANGNPNLTYYKYKLQIKDSCGNTSPMSLWHETIFIQDQLNGNFNWNSYAIELSSPPISLYNLKRRDITTGTETLVVSTVGNLATDPAYNSFWPNPNVRWFVDALGFNCAPSIIIKNNNNQTLATKTKTKSNQSNDKIATGIMMNDYSSLIKVYPNPAHDFINVDLNGLDKMETTVEIKNVLGQTVYQTKALNQHLNISTSAFSYGVYMVNVIQNNKTIAVKKVVVENN